MFSRTVTYAIEADTAEQAQRVWEDDGPEVGSRRITLADAGDVVERREWAFYVTDSDRSWGWSNHVWTLGCAFSGYGATADDALNEARADGRIPDELESDELVAIPVDAERQVTYTKAT